jgi:predicted nucleic acid-binding protein
MVCRRGWFGRGDEAARTLRVGAFSLELVAPQFWLLEVVAVIGRRARSKTVQADYPAQVLQALRKLRLELTPDAELLDHATQLSVTLRHPPYDCLYLAFSRRFDARMATFDTGLSEIARRDGRLWELR